MPCRAPDFSAPQRFFLTTVGTGQTNGRLSEIFWGPRKGRSMITNTFDRRTIAKMEVALERACLLLPTCSEKHRARRIIAGKIIECANRGDATLSRLTEVGYAAAVQLNCFGQSLRAAN
jgi:hypothetical protein